MERLHKYLKCSEELFITALVYLDRIRTAKSPKICFKLTSFNAYRLILASIVIAQKFHEELGDHYSNKFYAHVGGVSPKEMMAIEL